MFNLLLLLYLDDLMPAKLKLNILKHDLYGAISLAKFLLCNF